MDDSRLKANNLCFPFAQKLIIFDVSSVEKFNYL